MLYDPLHRAIDLPLTATFHPMGFPVTLSTNSAHVIDAAREGWSSYAPEFSTRPVDLRIAVQPDGPRAADPVFRSQRDTFAIVADRDNFAVYDRASLSGWAFLTEATVADHAWFRFQFLETMAYMLLAQEHAMPVHAACIARNDSGFLLYGHSGAGKSTLAWACARAGWTYVTDDGVWMLPDTSDRVVLGRSHQIRFKPDAPCLFPELAPFLAEPRPGGKTLLEVPLSGFPNIRTASRARIDAAIVLDRRPGAPAHLDPIPASEPISLLVADMPWYGEQVQARYQQTAERVLSVPAYRLTYDNLDEAVAALTSLGL